MRMNRSTLAVLLVSVVVIIGVMLFNNNRASAPGTPPTPVANTGPIFAGLDQSKITSVLVQNDLTGEHTLLTKDDQNNWHVDQATNASDRAVDQTLATTAISVPATLSASDSFQTDRLSDFGLASPTYTITVLTSDGGNFIMHIGDQNPTGNRYYVVAESHPGSGAPATSEATAAQSAATSEATAAQSAATAESAATSEATAAQSAATAESTATAEATASGQSEIMGRLSKRSPEAQSTAELTETSTVTPTATPTATPTRRPPTATAVPPTATSVPPTATAVPPTATAVPPTAVPPTATTEITATEATTAEAAATEAATEAVTPEAAATSEATQAPAVAGTAEVTGTSEATVEATPMVTLTGSKTIYLVTKDPITTLINLIATPPYVPPATATGTPYPTANPYSEVDQTATAAIEQTAVANLIATNQAGTATAAAATAEVTTAP